MARSPWSWIAISACALARIAASFAAEFARADNPAAPTFGTAWAPYSDSLGPWLIGGLSVLFDLPLQDYIYRPTVAYFWASILAVFGRVEAIPIFFTTWVVAMFAAAVLLTGRAPLRMALTLALAICALSFEATWGQLYVSSLNVDVPALAFTATGFVLLVWGRGREALPALLAGCLCLGIAAAIRGPMMLGGVVAIGARIVLVERVPPGIAAAAVGFFLLPIGVDVSLQRIFGITNNGLVSMYCFGWDPSHAWTPACHEAFLARKASAAQIAREYLAYVTSSEGFTVVRAGLYQRIARDLWPLMQVPALAALLTGGLLAGGASRPGWGGWARAPRIIAAVMAGLLLVVLAVGTWPPWPAAAWVCAAIVVAACLRAWHAFLCLAGYLAAAVFIALLGFTVPHLDRLEHTFTVGLYLGIALLVMEPGAPAESPDRTPAFGRWALPAAIFAAVAMLSLGRLGPSHLRDAWFQEARGRQGAALKVTEDRRIDRSLYFSGLRELFYVRSDGTPVGSVRRYRGLANDRGANNSFVTPNAFLD